MLGDMSLVRVSHLRSDRQEILSIDDMSIILSALIAYQPSNEAARAVSTKLKYVSGLKEVSVNDQK